MAKIRLLHTSDWHLGKRLFQKDRIPEQKAFLDWLYLELKQKQIDYLIVAGDIFDVPNPPNSALKLFYDFIYKLGKLSNLKTIIIGGNHDSSSLLEIPESFFKDVHCKIFTGLSDSLEDMDFFDELRGLKLGFKTLPYFKNFELINHLTDQHNKDEFKSPHKIKEFFQSFFKSWKSECDYKFLISHHSFGHSDMSGSEQAIYLSGVESFPLDWIQEHFDYVALGHIHKKIELSKTPPIIYPGSPIPMRFSESNHKKLIEINIEDQELRYEVKDIPVFRELFQIKGDKKSVEKQINELPEISDQVLTPFVEIIIELDKPKSGLAEKYKKSLKERGYELLSFIPSYQTTAQQKNLKQKDLMGLGLEDIFKKYYEYKFPETEVPEKLLKNFNEIIADIKHEDS
ncbi:MAG: hypothetical protein CME62_12780 [Halobacteriovoraceae bacterium]|nr:hypothetical protein [Halobacteriovoraceae bacterium]|tara:strand:+ start:14435 stop:15634 length:1200 start_codon:yes stop_codon:yes gene_type:complete